MLYKFKSKASGDVILLQANGDEVLRLLGRAPSANGIFEVDDLATLIARLEDAVRRAEAGEAGEAGAAAADASHAANDANDAPRVGLRQRAWPLLELMRRSLAQRVPVVWGV